MYEMKRQVTYSQVGQNLKTDMGMIVHFLQDCALFHSESIGKGLVEVEQTHHAWFLSSWQIEIGRYPEYKEEIRVRTWAHDFKGLYGYRNFDILDAQGNEIVRANSIWVFMDLLTGHPCKPTAEDICGYDMEPALDMDYAPRKIRILDGQEEDGAGTKEPIVVKRSFLDSNGHVNNGRYVTEAMEYLADKPVRAMRVDYRKAAKLGDILYPSVQSSEEIRQVIFKDAEGAPFVIIEAM